MKALFAAGTAAVCIIASGSALAQDNPFAAQPAENPFAAAQRDRYEGVFRSDAVELRIERDGDAYAGDIYYVATDKTYPFTAALHEDRLEGLFTADGKQFAFTFTLSAEGDAGVFETEGFRSELKLAGKAPKSKTLSPEITALFNEAISEAHKAGGNEATALSSIVGRLATAGDIRRAQKLADSIPAANSLREVAFAGLAKGEAVNGDMDAAKTTADKITSPVMRDTAYRIMATALAEKGDMTNASAAEAAISDINLRLRTIIDDAVKQAALGDKAGAKITVAALDRTSMMQRNTWAIRWMTTKEPSSGDRDYFNFLLELAEGYGAVGAPEEAINMTEWLKRRVEKAMLTAHIAKGEAAVGDHDGFVKYATLAEKGLKPGRRGAEDIYSPLADAYARAGEADKALTIAKAYPDQKEIMLSKIFMIFVHAGEVEKARLIAQEAANTPAFYAQFLTYAQAKAGDFDGALAAARNLSDAASRASAIASIALLKATQ